MDKQQPMPSIPVAATPEESAERMQTITTIKPVSKWPTIDFAERWAYRELLSILAWRDVSVRYNQSAVGIGWAL